MNENIADRGTGAVAEGIVEAVVVVAADLDMVDTVDCSHCYMTMTKVEGFDVDMELKMEY